MRPRAFALAAVLVCVVSVDSAAQTATGGTTTTTTSPTAPPTPSTEPAKESPLHATIVKFAAKWNDSSKWREAQDCGDKEPNHCSLSVETDKDQCRVDDTHATVYIGINADGSKQCNISAVPQDYRVVVRLLVPKEDANLFTLDIAQGEALKAVQVRGDLADVKDVLGSAVLKATAPTETAWITKQLDHVSTDKITIKVSCKECSVEESHEITTQKRYQVNLSVLAGIAFRGTTTYSVEDKKIAKNVDKHPVDYLLGVSIYPLAWHRTAAGWKNGRYFDGGPHSLADWVSIVLGVSISHPKDEAYLGLSIHFPIGIGVGWGWMPLKREVLPAGVSVGDMTEKTEAPVDKEWQLHRFAVSLFVDASVAKKIIGIFK